MRKQKQNKKTNVSRNTFTEVSANESTGDQKIELECEIK